MTGGALWAAETGREFAFDLRYPMMYVSSSIGKVAVYIPNHRSRTCEPK
jgi:hypothetical protein